MNSHWDKYIFFIIIACDQLTKNIVMHSMVQGDSIPLLKNIFHLTYVKNPGAAFGILEHQRIFLITMSAVVILATIYFYPRLKSGDYFFRVGMITILSGAMANLIDRIQFGYVIDFFDFRVWPVFNIADIAVVIGMSLIMYSIIFRADEPKA